jgi:predicted secreted protein with PEFG-CTERM motif
MKTDEAGRMVEFGEFPELGTKRLVLRRMTLSMPSSILGTSTDPDIAELTAFDAPENIAKARQAACGDTITVTLPQDVPDGIYTITVTWDHRYVETGFVVESQPVPEFPLVSVLILALAVASTAISRRKASVSAENITI